MVQAPRAYALTLCLVLALLAAHRASADESRTLAWPDLLPINDAAGRIEGLEATEQVRIEWNNRNVRIPGYIVPLEFDGGQLVTKFLLVPFFGACIHVPPPPPNQTIYAEFDAGVALPSISDPFWIEGRMRTTLVVGDLATAAYSMDIVRVEPYTGS